ncbi:hypothetical protein EI546_13490 [Aequorivita sp. H23M31]|uniref:Uncharacterized protein n=1 Tax=Aequorivita ciconiae TaxID=2494375 RepID=A0A410G5V2_9FLAO|nr:hypothetical protein [Aequorivita sp. H23M31]QAA82668.1 hypothetical protein EI546_13490 [Aequorivita sp. H23M31]
MIDSTSNSHSRAKSSHKNIRGFHGLISHFRSRLENLPESPLEVEDIDHFYDRINSLRFSFFGNYYRKYIENLNRFRPSEENNFDVTFLKIAIAEDEWKPTKPYPVFIYHLKYRFKLTSFFFIKRQKKRNHKKLNPEIVIDKKTSKFDSEKKWTQVPLGDKKCQPGCGCSK